MSKESTKAAFQKAFSTHMLLNLSPEEEASITSYRKSEERIRMEQQLKLKTDGTDAPGKAKAEKEVTE